MEDEIVTKCQNTIKNYLEKERKFFFGMFLGDVPGGFCQIKTVDRSYFVNYIIDVKMERFYVDAYPQIVCEKPYRQMMHAFANQKTSTYKSGRVDIDEKNGEVRIRIETSIVEHAVSEKDLEDMEHLAIRVCDELERYLDKIAHGVYFKEDDPELMSAAEREIARMKKSFSFFDDNDDDNGNEEGEDLFDPDASDSTDDKSNEENAKGDTDANGAMDDGKGGKKEDGKDKDESQDGKSAADAEKSFDDLFPQGEPSDD